MTTQTKHAIREHLKELLLIVPLFLLSVLLGYLWSAYNGNELPVGRGW